MMGKDKKKVTTDSRTISTLLGRDTVIEGSLSFKDTIRVDGRVKGQLSSSQGTLIIGENAIIEADIQVGVAIIRGQVHGRIDAGQRIEIYAPAQVNGDICAPTITIDNGVVFNGNCHMQTPSKSPETKNIENKTDPNKKAPEKV